MLLEQFALSCLAHASYIVAIGSVCAVLTDHETSPDPVPVFTGDTLFVGDVGLPDLSGDYTAAPYRF